MRPCPFLVLFPGPTTNGSLAASTEKRNSLSLPLFLFLSPHNSARASSAAPAPTMPSPSTLSSTAVDAPGAAAAAATIVDEAPVKTPWWEKHDPLPNIVSVSSVHELLAAFAGAGDKLVLIDVYAGE